MQQLIMQNTTKRKRKKNSKVSLKPQLLINAWIKLQPPWQPHLKLYTKASGIL